MTIFNNHKQDSYKVLP